MQGVTSYRVDLKSLRNQLNLYPAYLLFIHLPERKVLSFGALFCAKNFPFFSLLGILDEVGLHWPTLVVAT